MKKTVKSLLILLLSAAMFFSNTLIVSAEAGTEDAVILEMEKIDPDTLHVQKLGEETEAEAEDLSDRHDPDETVRVSIVLERPSTIDAGYDVSSIITNQSAQSYRRSLKSDQDAVTAAIEKKLKKPLDVKWNLTLAANIVSANVRYGDIDEIKQIDGVRNVVLENRYEPQTDDTNTANTSTGMVGATAAWADGYTGAGSRIAIIDTGIDTTHQSFNADAFSHSIDELGKTEELMTQISSAQASQLNSGSRNYVSAKIPYAYNYVDNNTTIDHMSDVQGNHGSHVAGIAAANKYIKNGSSYDSAIDSVMAVGMAPDAQLLIMKVFGAGGGAYDSDYMAAIEDAIVLECDSVNLSLGSADPGWTYDSTYQDILNNLSSSNNFKTVVTISAGNNSSVAGNLGRDLYIEDVSEHTGGSPGTFINSLGTASADNIGATGTPMKFNGKDIFYTATDVDMATIPGTYNLVYIDAIGNSADYQAINSAVSLSGKIVIVNRGEISFVDKANNAVSYSPKGLIVANNASGSISMSLDGFEGSFPVVSITKADADYIKANSASHTTGSYTYYTGSITVSTDFVSGLVIDREDAIVSDFSSWGVPGSLIMKPEITAPGGDIYSVYGTAKTSSGTEGGSNQYVSYTGTSMAAPHMAGLAAVVGQYLRETENGNDTLMRNYNIREITQSLLMSTATPMKNDGEYVSVLAQGSGLVEVSKAVKAASVIMMGKEDKTLTAETGAAADGKIKAEFGDDPDREGSYSFSFTIYNITDYDLSYVLNTKLFTQDHYEYEGLSYMDTATTAIEDPSVSYLWEVKGDGPIESHDVDMDGDTDTDDAQAILDYLSGKIEDDSVLDLEAGEMDDDEMLTTWDAHLLLNWEANESDYPANTVKARDSRTVTVTIELTDANKAWLDANYPNGAYIEGFTSATASGVTRESLNLAHEHTIPLLGFYGSWTDPSMFDNTSYVDVLYGSTKEAYSGKSDTNYLTLTHNGETKKFAGNPYMVEDEFPADRLAVNSDSTLGNIVYNLLRSAGTTGFAVSKLDEVGGDVTDILSATVTGSEVTGLWYYTNQGTWQNTSSKTYSINKKVSSYGLHEGETFRAGFYAIPEYNAMKIAEDLTDGDSGSLDTNGFRSVISSNVLGRGAFVGYDFTIDDTAPEILSPTLDGDLLSIETSDNQNLAYVAIMSPDGATIYSQAAPGTGEYSTTVDILTSIN